MTAAKRKNSGLVYSTEQGRMCPSCEKSMIECICLHRDKNHGGDGIIRVGRESKGRKGKGVTLISGVCLDRENLRKLAKELKQRCGSGGTVKDGIIEIQGDHRDLIIKELQNKGWKVKSTGG